MIFNSYLNICKTEWKSYLNPYKFTDIKNKFKMSVNDHIPAIRGKLEPRQIYPVTEEELEILEKGTSGSLYLNLAIVFFTTAVSTIITWVTLSDISPLAVGVMSGVVSSCIFSGSLFIIIWRKTKSEQKDILHKIRTRIEEKRREEKKSATDKTKRPEYKTVGH